MHSTSDALLERVRQRIDQDAWAGCLHPGSRGFETLSAHWPLAITELAARRIDDSPMNPSWLTVEHVLDGFLKHCQANHEPKTHECAAAMPKGTFR